VAVCYDLWGRKKDRKKKKNRNTQLRPIKNKEKTGIRGALVYSLVFSGTRFTGT